MNKFLKGTNKWVMALLLVAFVAGCGNSNDTTGSNEITAYSLSGTAGVVTEGTTPKTIDVVMPFGTDLSQALIATYTSTGISVGINKVLQESGVTENVFLSVPQAPVIYTVTAIDGSTATYDVNVTVAANDAAVMTTFSLGNTAGIVHENTVPKTIDVVMPFGTDLSLPLAATFVATGDVKIGTILQETGMTNVFPLSPPASAIYTVIAADGIAKATYEVNVTVAANDAAVMASYSINGFNGIISENTNPKTIAVLMPFGTDLSTDLAATFTASPGANVTIETTPPTPQVSAVTLNNFNNQVIVSYTVTAADTVTTATYDVSVTLAPDTVPFVDLGTAANYAILAKAGVSTVPYSVVTGNVGLSPTDRGALTGWSETSDTTDTYSISAQVVAPFELHAADYLGGSTSVDLTTAVANMETAYTDATGRTATSAATTNVGAGTLTSLTLTPGVYEWGTGVIIPTDLTLNGSATDVWIFKIAGTLDMAAAKNVVLVGGALPENIFWQVTDAVNIGANTHFEGNILGKTAITFGNLSSINGRLLAQTAVALDATTVTAP
ncbi:ice-binding family protein [Geopsychrobacter electrodiphilus]|uniref:ice-binding family protein n=1 Tax=Geopsychrobacter electrodiphilus TaxID=225196 RepID=UPI00037F00E0|nr:ice-binding family protein [Geopsychrobacter electrodiphilus]